MKLLSECCPAYSLVPCARSAEVFDRVEKGRCPPQLIPIENSLAGTVAEHADLLLARDVFVQAEFRLRIVHNVIAAPGVRFSALRKVLSHPVALDQCRDFFRHHPKIEAVPFYDTAGSVKHVIAEHTSRRSRDCRTTSRAGVLRQNSASAASKTISATSPVSC